MAIPRQAGFAPPLVPATDEEARADWFQVLERYRLGDPTAQIMPSLRRLWTRWPGAAAAVKAQLFAVETLHSDFLPAAERWSSQEFVDAALRSPGLYFSEDFERSTQNVALRALRWLEAVDEPAAAWRLCLRLRWEAPRVDRLALECRRLGSSRHAPALSPEATLALLAPTVARWQLPAQASPELEAAVRGYLAQPYDDGRLGQLVVALRQAQQFTAAEALMEEWLQLDSTAYWCRNAPTVRALAPDDCKAQAGPAGSR